MNKKYVPYIIGLPNLGVGLLWAMNMSVIPLFISKLNVSNAQQGRLISMGAFTGIFVQYLVGLLSDRSNFKMGKRKPYMIMGSILSALFLTLLPYSKGYSTAFILAFLFYFFLNFYQGPYYSLIPEAVDENQIGLANGFARVVSVVGSAIIFMLGPKLWDINFKYPFYLGAVLGLLTVIITVFLVSEDTSKYEKPNRISFDFIKFPSVIKLYLSVFMVYMSFGFITPFFVKYCTTNLNISNTDANNALLILTLAGAVFAVPIGKLADKIEKRKVLLLGVVLFALSLALGTFITSKVALFVMMSVIGIGFIAIQITTYSILAEIVPPERLGEFMGMMNLFISLPQFLANNIMGYMLDTFGYRVYFPTAAIAMVIAGIIVLTSRFNKYVSKGISNSI
ncbi:MFS transporter [Thermobrachium celere]|uniref:MFS transporter n=1 Tax=Thermobrachium celere TaxID=53422 RepID=UPI0019427018|nr:MFS transporter [Thermobrachium celere]GFR35860.1 MFS transporter [Thermobrachium celere]